MGYVIRISAYYDWICTYFVQTSYEEEAKRKAFEMAKGTFSCCMPDTLSEAEKNESICVLVLAKVEQIIL